VSEVTRIRDRPVSISEEDLMRILRCAIFYDSALRLMPPGILDQLSAENKHKIENWIEYEHSGRNIQ
jgi:hypothetical protein